MNEERKTGGFIADNVLDLVGNTPIVRINRLAGEGSAEILAKFESFSPGGSIKDRIAFNMIKTGEEKGLINGETVIMEPSSGNTGIGLAMVCAARGYRCVIVMPDSMSLERIFILKRFGAEVVLSPAKEGMQGAVKKVDELAKKEKNVFLPRQFENAANPEIHRKTTALEILKATGGRLDAFVAGIGTGGTITGVGEILKEKVPGVKIVAVEPENSPVLSKGKCGQHKIQGIGAGFVPQVLNRSVLDEIKLVRDDEAFEKMKLLSSKEGILAGISSGAAMHAALETAKELGPGKRVVVLLPDTGERYFTVQHYFEF
ncbi:MAG: cysteine synthase A [Deltaproteobacteria bacterium]|nr:cysteine synthase A [Deltaproteobacteria bacterium]